MRIETAQTPDGIVIRRIWASGEEAYRYSNAGTWAKCGDHKGPWVGVNIAAVPAPILWALVARHPHGNEEIAKGIEDLIGFGPPEERGE